ncbi:ATP-binding cassette domain-containing protein [Neptunomonas concharum]|uniref:ATP-binding cassette domain-containing protein n=1 Tax=Neptunomonas concharum TaxID=1031538 RepID=UPI001B8634AC|nr:ATP-binding cassette domain-containing protein [Neptunomonas concharum]
MSVIEIHNLKKTFSKSSIALKGINLTVASGDMVALIGPSGSGKSTLMRHISGLTLANKDTDGFVPCIRP